MARDALRGGRCLRCLPCQVAEEGEAARAAAAGAAAALAAAEDQLRATRAAADRELASARKAAEVSTAIASSARCAAAPAPAPLPVGPATAAPVLTRCGRVGVGGPWEAVSPVAAAALHARSGLRTAPQLLGIKLCRMCGLLGVSDARCKHEQPELPESIPTSAEQLGSCPALFSIVGLTVVEVPMCYMDHVWV